MKKIFLILLTLLMLGEVKSQDVGISGTFMPGTVAVGGNSTLKLIVNNNDGTAFPVGEVSVQVTIPTTNYLASMPTGDFMTYFPGFNDADGDGVWFGTNTVPIPASVADMVLNLVVTGQTLITPPQNFVPFLIELDNLTDQDDVDNQSGSGLIVTTALPVSIAKFNVSATDCEPAKLAWTTESETNNKGFNIERASDEGEFEVVGFVESNHNSTVKRDYTFTDKTSPRNGNYKYRLNAIDYDGKNTLSDIVSQSFNCFSEVEVSLFPNPAVDKVVVYFEDKETENYDANIIDKSGKSAMKTTVKSNVRNYVSVGNLPEGIYMFQIERNGKVTSKRFIKVK
jgi:hypothetical protein